MIAIQIVNTGAIKLLVTVRDLNAGAVPPVLPPTWIERTSPPISLYVQATDSGYGKIQWSAQDETGDETGSATADVADGNVIDVGQ